MTAREKKMKSAKKEEMANGEPVLASPAPSTRAQAESIYPIAALSFREAKTMPESPHEYTVRTPENEAAYVALFNLIVEHGVPQKGAVVNISIGTLVMALNTGT